MPPFKKQLHVTALQTLLTCGHRFYLRHVKAIHRPKSPNLAVGSAVHASAGMNLIHKVATKKLMPEDEILDHSRDAISFEIGQEEGLSDDGLRPINKQRQAQIVDETIAFSRVHYKGVAPFANPVTLEQNVGGRMLELPSVEWPYVLEMTHWPFNIAGKIDLLHLNDHSKFDIQDTKTTRKMPSENVADASIQMTPYSMAVHYILKQDYPITSTLDYLVIGRKTKPDEAAPRVTERDGAHEKFFLRIFERAVKAIEAGIFLPADPGHFASPCPSCEYRHGDCMFYRDPKTIGSEYLKGKERE